MCISEFLIEEEDFQLAYPRQCEIYLAQVEADDDTPETAPVEVRPALAA